MKNITVITPAAARLVTGTQCSTWAMPVADISMSSPASRFGHVVDMADTRNKAEFQAAKAAVRYIAQDARDTQGGKAFEDPV